MHSYRFSFTAVFVLALALAISVNYGLVSFVHGAESSNPSDEEMLASSDVTSHDTSDQADEDTPSNESDEESWWDTYEGDNYDGSSENGRSYQTHLRGGMNVPEVETNMMADIGLTYTEFGTIAYWILLWRGENVTKVELHCSYDWKGEGPVVATLYANPNGATMTGMLKNSMLTNREIDATANCKDSIGDSIDDIDDLIWAVKAGAIYATISTTEYPESFIRGHFAGDPYDPGTGQYNEYDDEFFNEQEETESDTGGEDTTPDPVTEAHESPPTRPRTVPIPLLGVRIRLTR